MFIQESQSGLLLNDVPPISIISELCVASTEFECFLTRSPIHLREHIKNQYGPHTLVNNSEIGKVVNLSSCSGFVNSFHEDFSVTGASLSANYKRSISWYSVEVATTPIYIKNLNRLINELKERINRLTDGSIDNYLKNHTCSNHIHFSLRYNRINGSVFSNFPARKVYGRFVKIVKKFYSAIRCLGFTTMDTNLRNTDYGNWRQNGHIDDLYTIDQINNEEYETFYGGRSSIVRSDYMNTNNYHIEMRHCDAIVSPLLLAINMQLIAAIFLWACDLTRNNAYVFVGDRHISHNKNLMNNAAAGSYNKEEFKEMMIELIANIYPYLRKLGGIATEEYLVKIAEKPASVFFTENNKEDFEAYEKYLNGKERKRDKVLRNTFLKFCRIGYFDRKPNLEEFKEHCANVLSTKLKKPITKQNVNSLYVMLKREGYRLEFEYGRLVLND